MISGGKKTIRNKDKGVKFNSEVYNDRRRVK